MHRSAAVCARFGRDEQTVWRTLAARMAQISSLIKRNFMHTHLTTTSNTARAERATRFVATKHGFPKRAYRVDKTIRRPLSDATRAARGLNGAAPASGRLKKPCPCDAYKLVHLVLAQK